MRYKLVFSDYDGTLEANDGVSEKNAEAVRDFVARGGIFVVCTGRMTMSVPQSVIERLGIGNQRICVVGLQGSHIVDKDGKLVYAMGVPYEQAMRIVKRAQELGVYHHYYDFDHCFVEERNAINDMYQLKTGAPVTPVGDLAKYLEAHPDMIIPKITTVVAKEDMQRTIEAFERDEYEGVAHYISAEHFLDFVSMESGKGNGLRKVAQLLGIPIEQTIAIGDSMNDLTMIEAAGLGVAVGNATDGLKSAADVVTVCNTEDAVAAVLNEFCKGE